MMRARTPSEERRRREQEQEQKDLERAVRTIMVMNLNLKATEKDVFDHFCGAGAVQDIRLILDKHTRRSKGIAYIEFDTPQAAINALSLNGTIMMNMPLLVKPSEAEKARVSLRGDLLLCSMYASGLRGAGGSPPFCLACCGHQSPWMLLHRHPQSMLWSLLWSLHVARRTWLGRCSRRPRRTRVRPSRFSTRWGAQLRASSSTPSSCRCARVERRLDNALVCLVISSPSPFIPKT
jgi:hypothetical protein